MTESQGQDQVDNSEAGSSVPSNFRSGSHRVGVIGGDGIGPEVLAEALKVVKAAGVTLSTTDYDLGADHYLATGEVLDDRTLERLRGEDAILLGAVGPPIGSTAVPSGLLERGLVWHVRRWES